MKARREIRIDGEVAYVPLTRGFFAVIDAADIPLVSDRLWAAIERGGKVYAGRSVWRSGTNKCELMHRVIIGAGVGDLVDHRNGDGLLNRRGNLRIASRSQNAMNASAHRDNTSGFKGVHWSKQHGKWKAEICAQGVRKHLGLFDAIEAASEAYRIAADRMHGQFARSS